MSNNKSVYLKIWNPDTDNDEWRGFSVSEVVELFDMGILDEDHLGYAMKNEEAFLTAMDELTDETKVTKTFFTFTDLTERYMQIAGIDSLYVE